MAFGKRFSTASRGRLEVSAPLELGAMESESLPLRKRIFSASEFLADFSPSRRLISSSKEVSRGMKKPRKVAALAVFGACVARCAWHQVQEHQRTSELMAAFDAGHDQHLSFKAQGPRLGLVRRRCPCGQELTSLLQANGVDVSQEQVGRMFGRVDDDGDGFDDAELGRILRIVSGLPAVSERVKSAAQAHNSWILDLILCTAAWFTDLRCLRMLVELSLGPTFDNKLRRWLESAYTTSWIRATP